MTPVCEIKQGIYSCFQELFENKYRVKLVDEGAKEPLYVPADADCPWNKIIIAHGFWNSALHEISHWCIAGEQRRTQLDYGYWYEPDSRSCDQQQVFQQVEAKPQALEWLFTSSIGMPFYLSFDSAGQVSDSLKASFSGEVTRQALKYKLEGMPQRAKLFSDCLKDKFNMESKFEEYWQSVLEGHVKPL